MKTIISTLVVTFFATTLFAQTDVAFSSFVLNENSSFQENYGGNTLEETKGEPWEKGFFIDLVSGFGSRATINPAIPAINYPATVLNTQLINSTSVRLGSKWYFGDNDKFRPGIQAVWARLGVVLPMAFGVVVNGGGSQDISTGLTFSALNVGSTNLLMFNENIGLEINFNIGFHSSFIFQPLFYNNGSTGNRTIMQFGVLVNPVVKFRYKKFSVGIDFSFMHGGIGQVFESNTPAMVYPYETNYYILGLTVGGKF